MQTELVDRLPELFVYLILGAFVLGFIGQRLAEASEAFAKILGPIGRYWRRKVAEENQDRKRAFHEEAASAIREAMSGVKQPDYEGLKTQLQNILTRVADMERVEAINTAYLIADANWHRETDMVLAEKGILEPPLPERLPYSEFAAQFRKTHGWS